MTPEKAIRTSDQTAVKLATAYWNKQTGQTNTVFDMHRPADALTLRVALQAVASGEPNVVLPDLPGHGTLSTTNDMLHLTLADALCVAARNDRTYQTYKESVFTRALDLDYQQYMFETTFSGFLLSVLSGDPSAKKLSGETGVGAARKWESGAAIAASLALDVVSLLRDDWRSLGLTGDLTMTLPLLRGSGREIVREPLTQAERDLSYALLNFEYYRQTYAVTVAGAYFEVLESMQRLQNARENERRLRENSRRAEMWFEAGRMQRIEVDQARTDLLVAGEGVISARRSYESKLDAFKMRIGLPPEAKINLDMTELNKLELQMSVWAAEQDNATEAYPVEQDAFKIALSERRDLIVLRHRLEDEARKVKVAADALRADLTLTAGGNFSRARSTGNSKFRGAELTQAGARFSFPWDRRQERNAYRKELLNFDQASRNLEEKEDGIKQEVREGYRNLTAACESYKNQVETMRVAQMRVDSNDLFLQAGRSSMRDILEAEGAMLSARNQLCSAVILWWRSDLQLRRDLGLLEINATGLWQDFEEDNNG